MKRSKLLLSALTLLMLTLTLTSCGEGAVNNSGLYVPFAWLLRRFYSWTGHYALALLLFALGVKVLLLPLSIRQQKGQIKMARIRPKMLAIEKKYAGRNDQITLRKKQEEIMALQQNEGYSPLAGCLPLLIQLPIIFILFAIIRAPLSSICGIKPDALVDLYNNVMGLEGDAALTAAKAATIDQIDLIKTLTAGNFSEIFQSTTGLPISVLPRFDLFGGAINLAETPSFTFNWLLLIPVITFISSVVTMRLSKLLGGNMQQMQAASADQKVSMGIMEWMMPVMSTWFAFMVPAAVGVYWFYQSVIGVVQMLILAKVMPLPKYTKEEMEQMLKDMKAKTSARASAGIYNPNGERPRSLHHIDDDDEIEEKPIPKKQHQNPPKK